MTEPERLVVIQDGDGRYYLLPWGTLQQARVADEKVPELECALEAEVSGYTMTFFTGRFLSSGDFTGEQGYWRTFTPGQAYSRVLMQQGRVQTDVDWPPR
jgi:hypothetical protein